MRQDYRLLPTAEIVTMLRKIGGPSVSYGIKAGTVEVVRRKLPWAGLDRVHAAAGLPGSRFRGSIYWCRRRARWSMERRKLAYKPRAPLRKGAR